jgi:hypothetical protein
LNLRIWIIKLFNFYNEPKKISPRLLSVLQIRDVFFNPKIVSKLSEILSEIFFPDPDLDFYPSQIPDPDSQP